MSSEQEKFNIIIKVSALVEKEGKLLLIKEKTPSSNGYKWNVIKGSFEPLKDGSLEDALTREILEETGVKSFKIIGITKSFVVKKESGIVIQINYYVTTEDNISIDNIKPENDEDIADLRLFMKDKLTKFTEDDFLTKRAHILVRDWMREKR